MGEHARAGEHLSVVGSTVHYSLLPSGERLRPSPSWVDDPARSREGLMKSELLRARPGMWGLFGKYVVSFVGLVVFVLAVNGALEIYITYRDTTTTVTAQQTQRAEAISDRIDQFISEMERQISWATRASSATVEQHRADYVLLLQQVTPIEELAHIGGDGREQLRVTRRRVTPASGTDFSRDPSFTEAVARGTWFGPAYFRNDTEPFMTIAMAHSGRNAGVTVAEINLAFLGDLIGGVQAGRPGYAYVIGELGRLLMHSDSKLGERGADFARRPQVHAVQDGQAVDSGPHPQQRRVLSAFAPVPRMNWYVFVEQPLWQALAPVNDLLFRLGWLLVLGLAVAVIAGTILARRMIVPIRALQAGASRLGTGEFGHRIGVRTGDELETLADQFNRMAEQLYESYSRLEQKVEERTRDLAQSVRELKALEEVGRAVASSLDHEAVLSTIVTQAVELAQADGGAIYTYDPILGTFRLSEAHGLESSLVNTIRTMRIDTAESRLGEAARAHEPLLIADLADIPSYPLRDVILAAGYHSAVVV